MFAVRVSKAAGQIAFHRISDAAIRHAFSSGGETAEGIGAGNDGSNSVSLVFCSLEFQDYCLEARKSPLEKIEIFAKNTDEDDDEEAQAPHQKCFLTFRHD